MDKKKVKEMVESNSKKVEAFNSKMDKVASGWVYPSMIFILIYFLSDGSVLGKMMGAVIFVYLILPKIKHKIIEKLDVEEPKNVELTEKEKEESVEVKKD